MAAKHPDGQRPIVIGDIVYYKEGYTPENVYCKVERIDIEPEGKRIWGRWTENLKDVTNLDIELGYMYEINCFLYKGCSWKDKVKD